MANKLEVLKLALEVALIAIQICLLLKSKKERYTRIRLGIPTAICGRTEETSITDSRLW
jgi:hypothetical protein